MNNKLSFKQHAFTLKAFETGSPGPAYFSVYKCSSMAVASSAANRLLQNVKVIKLTEELQKRAEAESVGTHLEACQTATQVMRARFVDFMQNLTQEKLRSPALAEITTTGEGPTKRTTIKLHSPLQGIDRLAKLMKWYEPEGGAAVQILNQINNIQVVSEKGKKLAAEILAGEGTE